MSNSSTVRLEPESAVLVLADGTLFPGISVGASGQAVGEVVFNTAMTGYQEILTDPSYARQIVTMTYPHIGNVGVNPDDMESDRAWVAGLVMRECSPVVSNWRATQSLPDFLAEQGVVAIAEVDTRRLTRILREQGAQSGCIITGDRPVDEAVALARAFPGLSGMDLANEVSRSTVAPWSESGTGPFIVVYDFGVKHNILNALVERGCRVTVVPATTSAQAVLAMRPDGVLLSNGPGDPAACAYAIANTQQLLAADMPILGICLGCQILALACGANTLKMKFGHHGANHPVKDLRSGQVSITSQNHGFAIDEMTLPPTVEITHRSLFDQTIQGIRVTGKPVFAFQGHPEASPGPHELLTVFDEFLYAKA